MAKEAALSFEGKVTELLPNATFRVLLEETNCIIIAHISGRLRKNFINILLGDRVKVECSVYDLSKGRITYRNS